MVQTGKIAMTRRAGVWDDNVDKKKYLYLTKKILPTEAGPRNSLN